MGWTGLAAQGAGVLCGLSSIFHGQNTVAMKSSPVVTSHPQIAFPWLVWGCLLYSLLALQAVREPGSLQHSRMSQMKTSSPFSADGDNLFNITEPSKAKGCFCRRPRKKNKISQCRISCKAQVIVHKRSPLLSTLGFAIWERCRWAPKISLVLEHLRLSTACSLAASAWRHPPVTPDRV